MAIGAIKASGRSSSRGRSRGPGVSGALLAAVTLLAVAAPARADEETPRAADTVQAESHHGSGTRVFGSSTTYFTGRQVLDPEDPTSRLFQMPMYQYLTLGADDVGVPGFSFYVSGWGRLIPFHQAGEKSVAGDVLIGTLTYTHPKNYVTVRAGRQILYESAGNNTMMDGVYVRVRPKIPLEISAFGGLVPFQGSDFDLDRTVFGGRIAYRPWHFGNIGVSYTGQRAYGQFDRSNLGVDYAFRYFRQVEFAGYVLVDLVSATFQETSNSLSYLLGRDWRFTLNYGMYDPSGRIPKTSIFSVFTDSDYHKVGLDVGYYGPGWLGASLYGRYFLYGGDEHGYEVGLRPTLRFDGAGAGSMLGFEVARLKGFSNAYTQARVFATWRPEAFRRLMITADANNYFYDDAIRGWDVWRRADPDGATAYRYQGKGGHERSHVVTLTAGCDLGKGARLQGDVAVHVNPDFTQAWSGLLKFQYEFETYVK
ncbi:MAG TPA: hypothetical protein PK313_04440 [Myxococcota bacterium]|jgi:hypothetical protein|nr:hypothetical protein [Myxococcota bacterium]